MGAVSEITVIPTAELSEAERIAIHEIFDATYASADHEYLDKSIAHLRYVALARVGGADNEVSDDRDLERGEALADDPVALPREAVSLVEAPPEPAITGLATQVAGSEDSRPAAAGPQPLTAPGQVTSGEVQLATGQCQPASRDDQLTGNRRLVGFALGETRSLDLPGLADQQVGLAGLCCVEARSRRRGLFYALERRALTEGFEGLGPLRHGRLLAAGRMAHPASFRVMTANPGVVPRPGVAPSDFQQEVGRVIAACYGVVDFDPLNFVCRGSGHPIGYPRMVVEVDPAEWEVFTAVDRENGDSLLGLSWLPDPPPGW